MLKGSEKATGPLAFDINASADSPLMNASIVIESWGDRNAVVEINGRILQANDGVRTGLVRHLERTDLVVWLPLSSTAPVSMRIAPAESDTSKPSARQ